MANTYQLIEAKTLGSSATSVTFSSIPGTYTDLKLVYSARSDRAGQTAELLAISFNGTTTNYARRVLEGNGSSAGTYGDPIRSFGIVPASTATSNIFSNGEIYIPNYLSSNDKSYSGDGTAENNATSANIDLDANIWNNSAAITSIAISTYNSNNLLQYSSFYLYGIKNS
jgi:hypothetical protein